MLEPISASQPGKVNEVISSLKSGRGLPFRSLLPREHLDRAMEKSPAFREHVFSP